MTYHMRDVKRLSEEAEERNEARFIACLTVFYILVLIIFVISYF